MTSTQLKYNLIDSELVTQLPKVDNPASDLALFYKPPVAPWMAEAVEKIAKFQKYKDDWDFEGAKSFSAQCIWQAMNFLGHAIKKPNLPKPNVVVGYHNDIVFFWARNGHELQVSVMPEGCFWISSRKSLEKFPGPEECPKSSLYDALAQFDLLSLQIM